METTDDDTFQQLLKEIQKLNQSLETASFAINNMTKQLSSLGQLATFEPALVQADENPKSSTPIGIEISGDTGSRKLGYINWDSSHDILESQCLIKMTRIREALKILQPAPVSESAQGNSHQRAITQSGFGTRNTNMNYSGHFTFNVFSVVDKETRFPQDAVYVDVNSPDIQTEIEFMNKLNVQPTEGVLDRFVKIVEKKMHTCSSFEKLHGLKWV